MSDDLIARLKLAANGLAVHGIDPSAVLDAIAALTTQGETAPAPVDEHHEQCPWHSADPTRTRSVCGCPEGWPKLGAAALTAQGEPAPAPPGTPPLLARAIADRDLKPWRYYRLDYDDLRNALDRYADRYGPVPGAGEETPDGK